MTPLKIRFRAANVKLALHRDRVPVDGKARLLRLTYRITHDGSMFCGNTGKLRVKAEETGEVELKRSNFFG